MFGGIPQPIDPANALQEEEAMEETLS